jgi:hypothetical protein
MRAPFVRVLSVVALAVLLGTTLAYGQEPYIVAKVDFSFGVPGKTLPAGEYTFAYNSSDESFLRIEGVPPNKEGAVVTILTRIAQAGSSNEARLVFDQVGDKSYLSEVWIPDQDGFLIMATPGKHTHAVIKATKASKK